MEKVQDHSMVVEYPPLPLEKSSRLSAGDV